MNTKPCTKCERTLPLDSFSIDNRAKSGRASACKECQLAHRKKTAGQINEYQRKWREKNAEKLRAHQKKYYETHKEDYLRRDREWRKNNPDKFRVLDANKKARRRGNLTTGYVPDGALEALMGAYGAVCMAPGCLSTGPLELDHVVPLTKGGSHDLRNLQLLCRTCNASKGNRSTADYRAGRIVVDLWGWEPFVLVRPHVA